MEHQKNNETRKFKGKKLLYLNKNNVISKTFISTCPKRRFNVDVPKTKMSLFQSAACNITMASDSTSRQFNLPMWWLEHSTSPVRVLRCYLFQSKHTIPYGLCFCEDTPHEGTLQGKQIFTLTTFNDCRGLWINTLKWLEASLQWAGLSGVKRLLKTAHL